MNLLTEKQIIPLSNNVSMVVEPVAVNELGDDGVTRNTWISYEIDAAGNRLGSTSCTCECNKDGNYCYVSNQCENGQRNSCSWSGNSCNLSCS